MKTLDTEKGLNDSEIRIEPYMVGDKRCATYRMIMRNVGIELEIEVFPEEAMKFAKEIIESICKHEWFEPRQPDKIRADQDEWFSK